MPVADKWIPGKNDVYGNLKITRNSTVCSRIEAKASIYLFFKKCGFCLRVTSVYRILHKNSALSNTFLLIFPFDMRIRFLGIALSNNSTAFKYSTWNHYFANNFWTHCIAFEFAGYCVNCLDYSFSYQLYNKIFVM